MIIMNLDVMLAKRKISSQELAARVGITPANLSILKTGKAKAMRFATLEAICRALECQPGDLLEYQEGPDEASVNSALAHFYWAASGGKEPPPGHEKLKPHEQFYKAIEASVEAVKEMEEAEKMEEERRRSE